MPCQQVPQGIWDYSQYTALLGPPKSINIWGVLSRGSGMAPAHLFNGFPHNKGLVSSSGLYFENLRFQDCKQWQVGIYLGLPLEQAGGWRPLVVIMGRCGHIFRDWLCPILVTILGSIALVILGPFEKPHLPPSQPCGCTSVKGKTLCSHSGAKGLQGAYESLGCSHWLFSRPQALVLRTKAMASGLQSCPHGAFSGAVWA